MSAGAAEEPRLALENVLALSDAMLENARREEWDEVIRCEELRWQAMNALFAEPLRDVPVDLASRAIEALLEKDKVVAGLALARREALSKSQREISRGKSAVRAYSVSV